MTRRSATHQRYRKDGVKGSTRSSSARAKPKRDAGESSGGSSSPKKAAPKKGLSAGYIEPSDEMKRLRRYWWILIGLAFGFFGVSWSLQQPWFADLVGWGRRPPAWAEQVAWALLAAYIITLALAFYLEFGPLKKERFKAAEAQKAASKSKGKK